MPYRLKLRLPYESASAVQDFLDETGDPRWSLFEEVVQRRVDLVGIFRGRSAALRGWKELKGAGAGLLRGRPRMGVLRKADWADSYRRHFKRWRFGRLHWVPVWEKPKFKLPPGHQVLWLDPGMAFGTGNHQTTRLCVERLVRLSDRWDAESLLDAGCGSGILALSASLLGIPEVSGFDSDPLAVRVSRENARANGLSRKVRFFEADVRAGCRGRAADIVVANIQADVLMANASSLLRAVRPGGTLILSGILTGEIRSVSGTFAGLAPDWALDSRTLGEWSDCVLSKPSPGIAGRRARAP